MYSTCIYLWSSSSVHEEVEVSLTCVGVFWYINVRLRREDDLMLNRSTSCQLYAIHEVFRPRGREREKDKERNCKILLYMYMYVVHKELQDFTSITRLRMFSSSELSNGMSLWDVSKSLFPAKSIMWRTLGRRRQWRELRVEELFVAFKIATWRPLLPFTITCFLGDNTGKRWAETCKWPTSSCLTSFNCLKIFQGNQLLCSP